VEKVVETRPESVWMSGSETSYSTYMALAVSSVIVCILRLCFSAGALTHLKKIATYQEQNLVTCTSPMVIAKPSVTDSVHTTYY
jgi:hypothetical protein